jgi:hypothetical protein
MILLLLLYHAGSQATYGKGWERGALWLTELVQVGVTCQLGIELGKSLRHDSSCTSSSSGRTTGAWQERARHT